jgi:hypothetical protein
VVAYDPRKRAPASEVVDALGFMSLGGVRENMWIRARGLGNRISCGERLWVGIYGGRCNGVLKIPEFMKIAYAVRFDILSLSRPNT